ADVKQILTAMPAPSPRPVDAPMTLAAASSTAADTRPHRRWQRDPTGVALLAGGVAAIAAGAVLLGVSAHRLAHAGDSYDDYLAARAAPDERTAGIVVLSAGVALGAGAAARFLVVRRR
ncbi:MAG: hypothetical protein JWM53_5650, partial [bacterium]|nr:hypothetical protein [bacterium]